MVHLVERGDITSTQASHRSLREGHGQLHLHPITVRFVSLYDSVSTRTYYGGVVKSFPDGEGNKEGWWTTVKYNVLKMFYNYLYIIIIIILNSIITRHTSAYRTEKFALPKPPRNILNPHAPLSSSPTQTPWISLT